MALFAEVEECGLAEELHYCRCALEFEDLRLYWFALCFVLVVQNVSPQLPAPAATPLLCHHKLK